MVAESPVVEVIAAPSQENSPGQVTRALPHTYRCSSGVAFLSLSHRRDHDAGDPVRCGYFDWYEHR
jgi:hypothetical protein